MKKLTILGSTGSIGTQALEVANQSGYEVKTLTANKNAKLIEQQARKYGVKTVALFDEAAARELKISLADTFITVLSGKEGIEQAASEKADMVLNSIVGIAGLSPTLCAIENGNDIALANKETLVTGGEIVNKKIAEKGVKLLPVDSEHSAIFQSLQGVPGGALKRILLTASGGPFFGKERAELENVTPAQALKHPNWSMGAKITIDSATLMNKGLEVIEAVHLFGVKPEDIEVLVHRQSILHSGIELTDGAVIAQLGVPDMKLPIQYALTYPKRGSMCAQPLDLFEAASLTFCKPDTETFRCLPLCVEAIKQGGLKPTAANGANEEAVRLFLEGKIKFLQIADLVEKAISAQNKVESFDKNDVFEADAAARRLVRNSINI